MSEKYNELKLYSPLTAELVEDEPDLDWEYGDVVDYPAFGWSGFGGFSRYH